MTTFTLIFAGVIGLILGSFLNAVNYRVPNKETLFTRSHCVHCNHMITAWENIPLISYLFLRGKCSQCKQKISIRYPLYEIITSLLSVIVAYWVLHEFNLMNTGITDIFQYYGTLSLVLAFIVFLASTITLTTIDIETQTLPRSIIYTTLIVVSVLLTISHLLLDSLSFSWIPLISAGAAFAFYFVIWFIFPRGMGFGDVRLSFLLGLMLGVIGFGTTVVGLFAGFVFGAIFGSLFILVSKKAGLKTKIPFGPWMIAGTWFGLVYGEQIVDIYLRFSGLR